MTRYRTNIKSMIIQIKSTFEENGILLLILKQICEMFNNLKCLNFSSSHQTQQLTFTVPSTIEFSSNILELQIMICNVDDCRRLLDSHFNQLQKLHVTICSLDNYSLPVNNDQVSYSYSSFFK